MQSDTKNETENTVVTRLPIVLDALLDGKYFYPCNIGSFTVFPSFTDYCVIYKIASSTVRCAKSYSSVLCFASSLLSYRLVNYSLQI